MGLFHAPAVLPPQGSSPIVHYAEGWAEPGTVLCAMRGDLLPNSGMRPRSVGRPARGVLTVSTVLKGREMAWDIVLLSLKTIDSLSFFNTHFCGTFSRRSENFSVGHVQRIWATKFVHQNVTCLLLYARHDCTNTTLNCK